MTVIESSNAPSSYIYPLTLPADVRLLIKEGVGNALLVSDGENGEEIAIGYINVPWAYDATGQPVPVSQAITATQITLTVDHSNATYPVYVDPSYYNIHCSYGYSMHFTRASDYIYWNGVCPLLSFYDARSYWPVGSTYMHPHRTVKQHGECSWFPDTSFAHDHQIPCKAHDYCYDLGREGYTYVTKRACDDILEGDLEISCNNYAWYDPRRYLCHGDIPYIMTAVRAFGTL